VLRVHGFEVCCLLDVCDHENAYKLFFFVTFFFFFFFNEFEIIFN